MAACVLLALISTVVLGAEVFRTTDANGNVTYTDRPQGKNSVPVIINTPRPAPPPAKPAAAPATAAQPPPIVEIVPPTAQEQADERIKNCASSRQRLESYTTSHRLYRETGDGEREYLSAAEIDEARAKAAADVETWCD